MAGRKLSTAALAGSIVVVAIVGGCRDEAPTGPSNSPSSAGYATNLRVQTGDVQSAAIGQTLPLPLKVKVVDAGGNAVVGASVKWTVIVGGGSVNPPTGVSDATGMVSTAWTIGDSLGVNTVRAYLSGSYVLDSATFNATGTTGSPVTILVDTTTLPGAGARVASTLAPIAYVVSDQFNHPVAGATVSFAAAAGSGTVLPTSAITGADGRVRTVWTLGTAAVTQSMTATLTGQLPIVIAETTIPDTTRVLTIVSGNNQSGAVSGTLPVALTAQLTDKYNNPINGEGVTFGDSLGNGNIVTQAVGVTNASGFVSATWQLGALAGPQTIRVKGPGTTPSFLRFTANGTVTFRDVFAGNFFTCGVTTANYAYCWGFGQDGQLGNEGMVNRAAPNWPVTSTDTLVAAPSGYTTFRSVSGGTSHACGVGVSSLNVWCWGTNPDGRQFMLPATKPSALSVDAAGPSFPANTQLASTRLVAAGESFSCGLTMGGIALCAGNDENGQTGNAIAELIAPTAMVDTVTTSKPNTPQKYSAIVTGARHACGMPRLGNAGGQFPWCWGLNSSGQLGNGTAIDSFAPQPVTHPVGPTAFDSTSLVAGVAHTCALVSSPLPGAAYCWGSNGFGQLGLNVPPVSAPFTTPQAVAGGQLFVRLYAGPYSTCGLTATGQAWCWGLNASGQLGDGTRNNQIGPVPIGGGLLFGNLALGEQHSCGIASATGPGAGGTMGAPGVVYCWGDNEFGQGGTNIFGSNTQPTLVPTRVSFQQ